MPFIFGLMAALFFSTPAQAEVDQSTYKQILEVCHQQMPEASFAELQVCVSAVQQRLSNENAAELDARINGIDQKLDAIVQKLDTRPTPAMAMPAPPSGTPAPARPASTQVVVSSTDFAQMDPVGRLNNRLRIYGLDYEAARRKGAGNGSSYVVFFDRGRPIMGHVVPDPQDDDFVILPVDYDGDGVADANMPAVNIGAQASTSIKRDGRGTVYVTFGKRSRISWAYLTFEGGVWTASVFCDDGTYQAHLRSGLSETSAWGCKTSSTP